MGEEGKLTILHDMYTKEGEKGEIDGLTVLVEGITKEMFDEIQEKRGYDNYSEVLRDIIFEGINHITTEGG